MSPSADLELWHLRLREPREARRAPSAWAAGRDGEDRARRGSSRAWPSGRHEVVLVLANRDSSVAGATRECEDAGPMGTIFRPVFCSISPSTREAVHASREERDDDRPLGAARHTIRSERSPATAPSLPARRRCASMFVESHMRRSADARVAQRAQALDVELLTVGRGLVELEVAGVDEHPGVGGDRERGRVGDRMGFARLAWNAGRSPRRRPSRGRVSMRRACASTSCSPSRFFHECRARRAAPTPGRRSAAGEVGERADAILVPVRQDDAANAIAVGLERAKPGMDDVDLGGRGGAA